MNTNMRKIKENLSQVKPRTMILLVAVILIVTFIVAIIGRNRDTTLADVDTTTGNSRASNVPTQVTPTPGGEADEAYYGLVYDDNQSRFEESMDSNTSAVPTIVNDQLTQNNSSVAGLNSQDPSNDPQAEYRQRLADRQAQALREAEERRLAELTAQQQAQQDAFEDLMTAQAQALLGGWSTVPTQTYVAGRNLPPGGNNNAGNGDGSDDGLGPVLYKAGDILYAVLETSINTDEPGPVLARIVSGHLEGARVIGGLQETTEYAQKVILQFNVLNIPGMPASQGFNAISIDPDTARTALASDVNNHYLLRYGTLLASSFLEGMGDAVLRSFGGQNRGFVNIVLGEEVETSPRDQVIAGLGNVGRRVGQNINLINRPPTITVDAGAPMGLLLMQDLRLDTPAPTGPEVVDAQTYASPNNTADLLEVLQAEAELGNEGGVDEMLALEQRSQLANQLDLLLNSDNEVFYGQ